VVSQPNTCFSHTRAYRNKCVVSYARRAHLPIHPTLPTLPPEDRSFAASEEHLVSHYRPPGQPIPPPPPARANSYLQPTTVAQQMHAPPPPTPQATLAAGNGPDVPCNGALLNEWRRRHGSGWVRSDALHPTVRELIDPQCRVAAVRQKLRQLVAACPELETEVRGNRAERVVLYRLTEIETAGLEG
jgi:hypothetical protein